MLLAAIRPDAWDFPLFVHVAGAMLLVGVLPAYILMRAGAEWIASEEDVPRDVEWVGIG